MKTYTQHPLELYTELAARILKLVPEISTYYIHPAINYHQALSLLAKLDELNEVNIKLVTLINDELQIANMPITFPEPQKIARFDHNVLSSERDRLIASVYDHDETYRILVHVRDAKEQNWNSGYHVKVKYNAPPLRVLLSGS